MEMLRSETRNIFIDVSKIFTASVEHQYRLKNVTFILIQIYCKGDSNQLLVHHYHISVMELGHLLTRSGLTYPEVSSKVCHDSFCHLGNIVSLPWVIYYKAFYLHVVSSFSCITVICLKLVLFLIPLQFVYLFCNLS